MGKFCSSPGTKSVICSAAIIFESGLAPPVPPSKASGGSATSSKSIASEPGDDVSKGILDSPEGGISTLLEVLGGSLSDSGNSCLVAASSSDALSFGIERSGPAGPSVATGASSGVTGVNASRHEKSRSCGLTSPGPAEASASASGSGVPIGEDGLWSARHEGHIFSTVLNLSGVA